MHKIDTENVTVDNEFQDADETQGVLGTDLNAAWFNTVQRELCNAVENFGQVLSPTNDGQLWKSLMRCGIRPFHVNGNKFEVTSAWTGSSVLLCGAHNFEFEGYLDKGSLLIVLPYWGASSPDFITVGYGLQNVKLYKGQGFFGICMNGEDELEVSAYPFLTSGQNGNTFIGNFIADSLKTKKYVDDGFITDPKNYGEVYAPWQLASEWTVGQVKRVLANSAIARKYARNFYCNVSGELGVVEFYPNSYREFMCIGTYTRPDNLVYAVLAVNGPEKRDEETDSTT